MIEPEVYLAYLIATIIVCLIPGPTVMQVVAYALAEGRRSARGTVPGVALGDLTAMTLSLAGLGAIMSASAELFTVLKWIGALYLVWLGVRMWRSKPELDTGSSVAVGHSCRAMMRHAFVVTALNPKSIAFFVAFLPQFVRPDAPVLPQLLLLGATFLVVAILNALFYALLAGTIRDTVRRPRVMKTVNRIGGGVLVGAGLVTAAARRIS